MSLSSGVSACVSPHFCVPAVVLAHNSRQVLLSIVSHNVQVGVTFGFTSECFVHKVLMFYGTLDSILIRKSIVRVLSRLSH
jgi:hypothetical protein